MKSYENLPTQAKFEDERNPSRGSKNGQKRGEKHGFLSFLTVSGHFSLNISRNMKDTEKLVINIFVENLMPCRGPRKTEFCTTGSEAISINIT